MPDKSETLESLIFNSNGNLDEALDQTAESKIPKAHPFMISIGEKQIEEDPHADKRKEWKKFVHAYKDDYLAHLQSGFTLMLSMLEEMSNEKGQDSTRV